MDELAISADSLSRSFGIVSALNRVTFSISPGTICSVLGPNGAGKTTLLRILQGMIRPTSGSCSIQGDFDFPRLKSTMQATGCLLDGIEPPGHLRVQELIRLNQGIGPNFDHPRAIEMLKEKQLRPSMVWRNLSKGQRRWTMLVMLLCRDCDVLLLDEPADGLDPEARMQLYQLIRREANDRRIAVLITTHIINDIEKVTDEVCILYRGQMVFDEKLEDLREQFVYLQLKDPTQLPEEVEVLRQDHDFATSIYSVWVRDITGVLEGHVLPSEVQRNRVNLEQLYFAITNEAADRLLVSQSS